MNEHRRAAENAEVAQRVEWCGTEIRTSSFVINVAERLVWYYLANHD
jgi:hypothetical protein